MTEIIYQSDHAMVVKIGDIIHFIATMKNKKYSHPVHEVIRVNGSCVIMDGAYNLPDATEALSAVSLWALKKDTAVPSNKCTDPSCPCLDGEPCHYADWQGTKAMTRLSALVPPNAEDNRAGQPIHPQSNQFDSRSGESDCWAYLLITRKI